MKEMKERERDERAREMRASERERERELRERELRNFELRERGREREREIITFRIETFSMRESLDVCLDFRIASHTFASHASYGWKRRDGVGKCAPAQYAYPIIYPFIHVCSMYRWNGRWNRIDELTITCMDGTDELTHPHARAHARDT